MGRIRALLGALAVCGIFAGISASPALAEKRVALVIGNDRYANLPAERQLLKAVNDAQAIGDALAKLGFTVIRGQNLGRQGMIDKLSAFTAQLEAGDTAAFFYAGHGVAIGGVNYLVPSDVPSVTPDAEARVRGNSIAEGDVVAEIQGKGARVALLVLDACRDNPFPRSGTRSIGNTRGLADAKPARGVFTIYSAGIGQTALDRLEKNDPERNSVFTRVFVQQLARTDLHLGDLIVEVREKVAALALKAKNDLGQIEPHEQTPAYYDQTIGGRVYLAGRAIGVAPRKDAAAILKSDDVTALQERLKTLEEQLKKKDEPKVAVGTFPEKSEPAPSRQFKPGDTFKDCNNCPDMVVVPAGSFTMGSPANEKDRSGDEGPQHRVTIAKPFAVGKFEVAFAEWDACVADGGCNGYRPLDQGWGRGKRPVINVSWDDAKSYVAWLSRKTGKAYRLLSEAEWEYVARAGTTTPFFTGRTITTDQANFDGNYTYNGSSKGQYRQRTVPVGSFTANAFGLHDMRGNVWEWTEDCYKDSYAGAPTDGSASIVGDCSRRVLRGGSWDVNPWFLRSAGRLISAASDRYFDAGFRVARTLAQ